MPRLAIAGLTIWLVCPATALLAFGLAHFMPNCKAGDTGPASGCHLLGVDLNWFVDLGILALLASFLTLPLGALTLALLGSAHLVSRYRKRRRKHQLPYGLYASNGRLLSLGEASEALRQFDEESCNRVLRAFGCQPRHGEESLEQLRQRCVQTLSAATTDAT